MNGGWRAWFWPAMLAVLVLVLYALRGVLLPFVAGMAIAYFLDPLVGRLQRLGLSRLWATLTITLVFFVLVVGAVVLLAPVIQDQVSGFGHRIPDYVASINQKLNPLIRDLMRHLSPRDIERLRSSAGDYAGTAVTWGLGVIRGVLTGGLAVVNLLSLIFITPIVTFYLLRDWDQLVVRVESWLPRAHAATIRTQMGEINRILAGFVRGQATVCLVLAAYYALALSAVGIDLGLIIGLGAGALSFVPYLGFLTGLAVSVGVGFAESGDWMLPALAVAVFAVGSVVEGYFLTPKLVGGRIGLHPVWVMFALLAGGALVGFLGVLLAVPVAAVAGVLTRFALDRYLASPLYTGRTERR